MTDNATQQTGFGFDVDDNQSDIPADAIISFRGPYRWLSNFFSCKLKYEGLHYPTRGETKRAVPRPADWRVRSLSVMAQLIDQKFNQPFFRGKLLATGDRFIVEGNSHGDVFFASAPWTTAKIIWETRL